MRPAQIKREEYIHTLSSLCPPAPVCTQKKASFASKVTLKNLLLYPLYIVYRFVHYLMGFLLIHARYHRKSSLAKTRKTFCLLQEQFTKESVSGLTVQRISFALESGAHIDGVFIKNPLAEGATGDKKNRYLLLAKGMATPIEKSLFQLQKGQSLRRLLDAAVAHGVLFNYPGVGSSGDYLTQETMIEAAGKGLQYIENTIQPKQILVMGKSMGGGVISTLLRIWNRKKGVQYIRILDRTFSSLFDVVKQITCSIAAYLVYWTGWHMQTISPKDTIPTIVLQTARQLKDGTEVIGDGVIPKESSAMQKVKNLKNYEKNYRLIGVNGSHRHALYPSSHQKLQKAVEELFQIAASKK